MEANNLPFYEDLALRCGFNEIAPLPLSALLPSANVRSMCQSDLCQNYGRNWRCPPALPSLEVCQRELQTYGQAFLLVLCGEIEDSFDYESMLRLDRQHGSCMQALKRALTERSLKNLLLGAGGCRLCPSCTYPQQPCRHPNEALSSLEAYGLLVSDLCKAAQIPYHHKENKISFFGALLL